MAGAHQHRRGVGKQSKQKCQCCHNRSKTQPARIPVPHQLKFRSCRLAPVTSPPPLLYAHFLRASWLSYPSNIVLRAPFHLFKQKGLLDKRRPTWWEALLTFDHRTPERAAGPTGRTKARAAGESIRSIVAVGAPVIIVSLFTCCTAVVCSCDSLSGGHHAVSGGPPEGARRLEKQNL